MEWVRLEDVFDISIGKTPSRSKYEYWGKGHTWISISDLDNKYIYDSKEEITDLAIIDTNIKLVPKNTVIMSFKLSIGKVGITKKDLYTNEAIAHFIPKNDIDLDYTYYALKSINYDRYVDKAVKGKTLNKKKLNQIKIPLLNKNKQIVLSEILLKLENLIENRKEQIQAYDDLIESLFFEIINKSSINEVSFDDMFEIIDGDRGKNYPKKNDLLEEGYCLFLNTKNVTKTGFKFDQQEFITKEKDEKLRKGRAKKGDFILTTRGTVGNIAYIDENIEFKNIRINSGMVILRKKLNINPKFFEVLIRETDILLKAKSGSAQPQLPIKSLKKILIPTVDIELQNKFAEYVIKIEEEKKKLNSSLKELEDLFDALMQDAFSGNLFKD